MEMVPISVSAGVPEKAVPSKLSQAGSGESSSKEAARVIRSPSGSEKVLAGTVKVKSSPTIAFRSAIGLSKTGGKFTASTFIVN